MFLHVAHWNILAAGNWQLGRCSCRPRESITTAPLRRGFCVDARATLRVVEELDDTKTGVSSSLHSLNTEFGAARVAALPRAAWWLGVLVAERSGGHCSAAPAVL